MQIRSANRFSRLPPCWSLAKEHITIQRLMSFLAVLLLYSSIQNSWESSKKHQFVPPELYTTTNNSRIPRIIHQSYISEERLPDEWAQNKARWESMYTKLGYVYRFYSDENNRELIATHFSWFLPTYDSYPHPIQRADTARYFTILHYGGLYADLDIFPRKDITPILSQFDKPANFDREVLVAETHNMGLTNALFAAVKDSAVLNDFVHTLPSYVRPFYGLENLLPHFEVMFSTGPTRFWMFFNQGYRDKIMTLSPAGWGQCHQCRQGKPGQCELDPEAFLETTKGGSWHQWDTSIINYVFCRMQFTIWLFAGFCVWVLRRCIRLCTLSSPVEDMIDEEDMLPLLQSPTDEVETKTRRKPSRQISFRNAVRSARIRWGMFNRNTIAQFISSRKNLLTYWLVAIILYLL